MRDYQVKTNVGGAADSISTTKLGGGEFTSLSTESENAVEKAGLTLALADGTDEDLTQLAQALLINGSSASTFQDGGSASTIELTPVTGLNGLLLPPASPGYDALNGMKITFVAAADNAGTTTVNIGQTGAGLFGTRKLFITDTVELVGGEIVAGQRYEIIFDATADTSTGAFLLVPWTVGAGLVTHQTLIADGTTQSYDFSIDPGEGGSVLISLGNLNTSVIASTRDVQIQIGTGTISTTNYTTQTATITQAGALVSIGNGASWAIEEVGDADDVGGTLWLSRSFEAYDGSGTFGAENDFVQILGGSKTSQVAPIDLVRFTVATGIAPFIAVDTIMSVTTFPANLSTNN